MPTPPSVPAPLFTLALALSGASLGGGCIAVRTHTVADVVVETARGHEHLRYESWESHNLAVIAIGCVLTATFYGGACWAYLATPFDEHELVALEGAQRDVGALGNCAHVISARTSRASWTLDARRSRLSTLKGATVSTADAARLCTRQEPPTAPVPPVSPSPPAPRAPTPPASQPPREVFDPAEP